MTSSKSPLLVPVTPDAHAWLCFHPSPSGWAIYRTDGKGALAYRNPDGVASLFIRFGVLDGPSAQPVLMDGQPAVVARPMVAAEVGAFVAREVLVSFRHGVGPRVMRDLPLARAEAAVNQPAYRAAIAEHLPPANAIRIPFPDDDETGRPDWLFARPEPTTRRSRPRLRLRVPPGRPKPDEFYAGVAERFAYLTTTSKRPATELAEANGVPVSTVHGWVKEARRRGLLPPGERSRRGKEQLS